MVITTMNPLLRGDHNDEWANRIESANQQVFWVVITVTNEPMGSEPVDQPLNGDNNDGYTN